MLQSSTSATFTASGSSNLASLAVSSASLTPSAAIHDGTAPVSHSSASIAPDEADARHEGDQQTTPPHTLTSDDGDDCVSEPDSLQEDCDNKNNSIHQKAHLQFPVVQGNATAQAPAHRYYVMPDQQQNHQQSQYYSQDRAQVPVQQYYQHSTVPEDGSTVAGSVARVNLKATTPLYRPMPPARLQDSQPTPNGTLSQLPPYQAPSDDSKRRQRWFRHLGLHRVCTLGRCVCVLLLLAVVAAIVLFSFRTTLFGKSDPTNNRKLLKLDAANKGAYFGVSVDWEAKDTPAKFNRRFGKPAAVFQHFMDMGATLERVEELKFIVDAVLQVDGALLAITVIPSKGLSAITRDGMDQMGRVMAAINKQGVPVLLRYGHEMNGNWYSYGQQPVAYKQSFREAAAAVRKHTNQTYMVWGPNNPGGYPYFGPDDPSAPRPGTANFIEMDTDKNGVIDNRDDPYTPYYPGDDVVDWIGFSIFHFGAPDLTRNSIPEPTAFASSISYRTPSGRTWDLYQMFCVQHNKPLAIMETAAAYHPENVRPGDPTELQIKRAWWQQVFNAQIKERWPLLKLICWFDIRKAETVSKAIGTSQDLDMRDFRLTWDQGILDQFMQDIPKELVFFADAANVN